MKKPKIAILAALAVTFLCMSCQSNKEVPKPIPDGLIEAEVKIDKTELDFVFHEGIELNELYLGKDEDGSDIRMKYYDDFKEVGFWFWKRIDKKTYNSEVVRKSKKEIWGGEWADDIFLIDAEIEEFSGDFVRIRLKAGYIESSVKFLIICLFILFLVILFIRFFRPDRLRRSSQGGCGQ